MTDLRPYLRHLCARPSDGAHAAQSQSPASSGKRVVESVVQWPRGVRARTCSRRLRAGDRTFRRPGSSAWGWHGICRATMTWARRRKWPLATRATGLGRRARAGASGRPGATPPGPGSSTPHPDATAPVHVCVCDACADEINLTAEGDGHQRLARTWWTVPSELWPFVGEAEVWYVTTRQGGLFETLPWSGRER